MNNALLTKFINKHKRTDIPEFRPGDTIRVHVRIKEGDKERLQAFEGTLIARNNTGMGETITVRKVSFSHGVERIFPLHARVIDHIDVIRTGKVPFVQSRASWQVTAMGLLTMAVGVGLPFSPLGRYLGFRALPPLYWPLLLATLLSYLLLTQAVKMRLVRRGCSDDRQHARA